MLTYLIFKTPPPVIPPSQVTEEPLSEVFWVAVIGLVGTLVAGLVGPWVQSIATRRAEKRTLVEREKLEFVRSIIDDLGALAEIDRWEDQEKWDPLYARIARTVTNLELILPKEEREIGTVIMVSTMYIKPGETPLEKSSASLTQFALLNRIKSWYTGETKAKGLLSDSIGATMAIRESLLRGEMMPNGEPLKDDQLTPEELRERLTMGVSFPAGSVESAERGEPLSGSRSRWRKVFSRRDR